jgi:toxin ParE1/3/4
MLDKDADISRMRSRYSYFFAPKAEDDIVGIATFGSSEWGEIEATRYVQNILDVLDDLTVFPFLGREITYTSGQIRSIGSGSHVIYYRVDESSSEIEIVRVLHARMNAMRHLGQF